MLDCFLEKTDYLNYDEFSKSCKVKIPENFNFSFDIMDDIAARTPDKKALIWCDVDGDNCDFTFQELKELSNKAANFFIKAGVKKGDFVMLILKRRYEFWYCTLGLHKIGAVVVPATHLLTTKDVIYRNNSADIKMIVTAGDERILDHVDEAMPKSPSVKIRAAVDCKRDGWYNLTEEIANASPIFERPTSESEYFTTNNDYFLMYFTSGTTGHPKMVIHDYTYPLGHIYTAHFWQQVDPNGLHLTVADTGWAKCAWGKLYGQWIAETAIFVYDFEKFVAHDLLTIISKYNLTTFCAPPTIYRFFIKEDLSKYDLSSIKHCSTAGEPLNPEVYNQFYKQTGHRIMEGFGQTESTVLLGTFKGVETRPGSMGLPCPGYDIDLVDENGQSVEAGEEGQIVVRTHNGRPAGLFCGYYKNQELTDKCWHDNMYHIGDIAWKDEDGYYWFVGRADDVIKSSGYRIGPFEVESALIEHKAVLECAITGVPHPDRGAVVKATVVLAKGFEPSYDLIKELQNHVKNTTAPYKYPRIVEFVEELPKTISGKIKRNHIRDTDTNATT